MPQRNIPSGYLHSLTLKINGKGGSRVFRYFFQGAVIHFAARRSRQLASILELVRDHVIGKLFAADLQDLFRDTFFFRLFIFQNNKCLRIVDPRGVSTKRPFDAHRATVCGSLRDQQERHVMTAINIRIESGNDVKSKVVLWILAFSLDKRPLMEWACCKITRNTKAPALSKKDLAGASVCVKLWV